MRARRGRRRQDRLGGGAGRALAARERLGLGEESVDQVEVIVQRRGAGPAWEVGGRRNGRRRWGRGLGRMVFHSVRLGFAPRGPPPGARKSPPARRHSAVASRRFRGRLPPPRRSRPAPVGPPARRPAARARAPSTAPARTASPPPRHSRRRRRASRRSAGRPRPAAARGRGPARPALDERRHSYPLGGSIAASASTMSGIGLDEGNRLQPVGDRRHRHLGSAKVRLDHAPDRHAVVDEEQSEGHLLGGGGTRRRDREAHAPSVLDRPGRARRRLVPPLARGLEHLRVVERVIEGQGHRPRRPPRR